MSTKLTICRPSAARNASYDKFQFEARSSSPVAVRYKGEDEWESTGLSFSDYNFCQTRVRKGEGKDIRVPKTAPTTLKRPKPRPASGIPDQNAALVKTVPTSIKFHFPPRVPIVKANRT